MRVKLCEDYGNGRVYHQDDGQMIWTPAGPYPKLDRERFEVHAATRFLDA